MTHSFVDIHCHILPGIDDGPCDWDESLAMARLAVDNCTSTIIATPHQLGSYAENRGDDIRARVSELQQRLDSAAIPLHVLPGGEVRIEAGLADGLLRGDVLSLGDHHRHALIELPHEIYLPLSPSSTIFRAEEIIGILAHPERNQGILRRPELMAPLVDAGCLAQITAGSLCGSFGPNAKELAEWLLAEGLVHFVASDGHGPRSRRPLLRSAYDRVATITNRQSADDLFHHNPACVAAGQTVSALRRARPLRRQRWWARKAVA